MRYVVVLVVVVVVGLVVVLVLVPIPATHATEHDPGGKTPEQLLVFLSMSTTGGLRVPGNWVMMMLLFHKPGVAFPLGLGPLGNAATVFYLLCSASRQVFPLGAQQGSRIAPGWLVGWLVTPRFDALGRDAREDQRRTNQPKVKAQSKRGSSEREANGEPDAKRKRQRGSKRGSTQKAELGAYRSGPPR